MTQFRRLLVHVSPPREVYEAVDCAVRLAGRADAQITLIGVEKALPVYLQTPAYGYPALSDTLEAELREALEDIAGRMRHDGLRVETVVRSGKPQEEVAREAVARKADIVLTQGEPRARALQLLRLCPCPVWAVKGGHVGPHRRVLAAVDPLASEDNDLSLARRVIEHASAVGRLDDSEVHVLHVWGEGLRQSLLDKYGSPIETLAREALERLVAEFSEAIPSQNVHLEQGDPAAAVRRFAAEQSMDLIVMGTIARSGIAGLLLGSTAEKVLGETGVSVLAVKPGDFVSPVAAN